MSDNNVHYRKAVVNEFSEEEIFQEGRSVKDLNLEFQDMGRYVRIVLRGAGRCPDIHVRPGMEARICLDEVLIE